MELSRELIAEVENIASYNPSIYEIEAAYDPAKRKLDDLIKRFGTDDGKRLKTRYLAHLIVEQMRSERFAVYCQLINEQKKSTLHMASVPSNRI